MRRLIFLCVLLAATALAAGAAWGHPLSASNPIPTAAAWESFWFVSPTHNIHCRWWRSSGLVGCMTENNNSMVAVSVYGQPWHQWGTGGYSFPDGPTLAYGSTYTGHSSGGASVVRCWSRSTGMTCKSLQTGRGFWIAREGYRLF